MTSFLSGKPVSEMKGSSEEKSWSELLLGTSLNAPSY